jgi:hypothetical protein
MPEFLVFHMNLLHQPTPLPFEASYSPFNLNSVTGVHRIKSVNHCHLTTFGNLPPPDSTHDEHVFADVTGIAEQIFEVPIGMSEITSPDVVKL